MRVVACAHKDKRLTVRLQTSKFIVSTDPACFATIVCCPDLACHPRGVSHSSLALVALTRVQAERRRSPSWITRGHSAVGDAAEFAPHGGRDGLFLLEWKFSSLNPKVEIRAVQVAPHNLHLYRSNPFFFIHKSFEHALALCVKKVRAALAS
jgi:hypothetical protein